MHINDRLRAAYNAYSSADFIAAQRHAEAALKSHPNHPVVLQLLGVLDCQLGNLESGAAYLERAMRAGADTVDTRLNLGQALLALGRFDEARALCEGGNNAKEPKLQQLKAEILKAQGSLDQAIWAYEDNIAENPADFDSWNNLGNARHQRGDLEGALSALDQARLLNDKSSLVHTNIGRVLISLDRYEEACLFLEKAALLAPGKHEPLIELARSLINVDQAAAGLRALGDAAKINPRDPKIFWTMGMAFNDLSNPAQAEKAYRIGLQVAPNHGPSYLDLGILLEKANRLDELEALLSQGQEAGVVGPEMDYLRALSLSRKQEQAAALELVKPLQSPTIHPAIHAQFVGQLADRLGRVDEAFAAYETMNQAMGQTPLGFGKDRQSYQRAIDEVAAKTTPEWYRSWTPAEPITHPASPAFLVGFPRSGTTLLDTILMGHSKTHVLEELPIIEELANGDGAFDRIASLTKKEIEALRARYFQELTRQSPAPQGKLIIDKNPLSMIRMPLIHRLFPDAKIILALRHPADVVLSCYMQNFKPTESMSSFLDLPNASRTYDRIFSYWEKSTEVLPLDVHVLRYEDLVTDTEATVRPLFDFLGLEWEDAVLDHQKTAKGRGYIRTPSYAQVTERVYTSASGRWQRYYNHMKEVLPILEPWIDHFGYDKSVPEGA